MKSRKSTIFSAFQAGRIQDTEPHSHKTNIWDITYAMEGQPLSPVFRLIPWRVSKLEPTPFALQVKHQVHVQVGEAPAPRSPLDLEGRLLLSPTEAL